MHPPLGNWKYGHIASDRLFYLVYITGGYIERDPQTVRSAVCCSQLGLARSMYSTEEVLPARY